MSVSSYTTKAKKKETRKRLISPMFFDKAGTYSSGSVAAQRIGQNIKRIDQTVSIVVTDDTINGTKENSITTFGEDATSQFDSFRFGKDVKFVKHLLNTSRLIPNLSMGSDITSIDTDDYLDHSFKANSYGQNSLFETYDFKKDRFIPFHDLEGKPLMSSFIGTKDEDKSGFPYLYDKKRNYFKFREPDEAALDGAIEVFHVRRSPINAGFLDIQIKGARGLFGVGNWELTSHSTYGKKGSPLVSEVYEIKQKSYDFFEDADESILSLPVEGFVSDGLYTSYPFVDKDIFEEDYEHVIDSSIRASLLLNSSRDTSEIGTRYKSMNNGFVGVPFESLVEKRSFGKDSIAFSGLLKG